MCGLDLNIWHYNSVRIIKLPLVKIKIKIKHEFLDLNIWHYIYSRAHSKFVNMA